MLRIGVTGHRHLAEPHKLEAAVASAIARIEAAFRPQAVQVLSSLAEGADRLVGKQLLGMHGAQLVAPLPLPRAEYEKDFAGAASRAEFAALLSAASKVVELPPSTSRRDAYRNAGFYVLDHSDVVVAVWDGQPQPDSPGTAGIVAEARRRHLPLAWIHAAKTGAGACSDCEPGTVTFENFPRGAAGPPRGIASR